MEVCHGLDHGGCALVRRVVVADSAALALASAGRVCDGLGRGAGVGLGHHVDEALGGAVARRGRRLPCPEDVDSRAGLALLELHGTGAGEAGEEGNHGCGLHGGNVRLLVVSWWVGMMLEVIVVLGSRGRTGVGSRGSRSRYTTEHQGTGYGGLLRIHIAPGTLCTDSGERLSLRARSSCLEIRPTRKSHSSESPNLYIQIG